MIQDAPSGPEDAGRNKLWPHPIRAVAFDMDGLMLNTEELYFEVGSLLLQRRGKVFSPTLRRGMMGLPGHKAFELMIATEQLVDTVAALQSESDTIFTGLLEARVAPLPGLLALLEQLDQAGLPRCVATSSRRSFAELALTGAGVLHRVDFIVTAEDVEHGKPAPDIYLAAAARLGVAPQEMLVLEDSQHGTHAGVAAGACTIAVPGEHSADHDFTGAAAVASSLADPRVLRLVAAG
jgi:pseudouridine 5'-phosphatase